MVKSSSIRRSLFPKKTQQKENGVLVNVKDAQTFPNSSNEELTPFRVLQAELSMEKLSEVSPSLAGNCLHFVHGGFCPPVPVSRRQRIRSRKEIEAEIHALNSF